jgi:hypothetical protein
MYVAAQSLVQNRHSTRTRPAAKPVLVAAWASSDRYLHAADLVASRASLFRTSLKTVSVASQLRA